MKTTENIKIAYIGGGSRGWAWGFMKDLALHECISGTVYLYDIDKEAAQKNEYIGNHLGRGRFNYKAVETLKEALISADFVIISILPGTFDEMESDVHTPEKYGVYQSVGDTTGPGGAVRALRTLPMYIEFAEGIRDYCPDAWVINYTNPMAACVATLYKIFPKIKAYGCCHEVFGAQKIICSLINKTTGENVERHQIRTTPIGINHFTWITEAKYNGADLYPLYKKYADGEIEVEEQKNWVNIPFQSYGLVRKNLFRFFGTIAAAGDRHLAEFCPGNWFLKDPETVKEYGFSLTPVSYRKNELKERYEKAERLYKGEEKFDFEQRTGEEGVNQICAILGLGDIVTNVNMPNMGQIANIPLGTVVETNALFSGDSVKPIMSGSVPQSVYAIMAPAVQNQTNIVNAALSCSKELALQTIITDNLSSRVSLKDAEKMLDTMLENTKKYLPKEWNL